MLSNREIRPFLRFSAETDIRDRWWAVFSVVAGLTAVIGRGAFLLYIIRGILVPLSI